DVGGRGERGREREGGQDRHGVLVGSGQTSPYCRRATTARRGRRCAPPPRPDRRAAMATEKRAPTERDRQREETHRRLFETALDLFRRDGIEAASIEEIANRAGVSRGTFYFHFPTKDDVLLELIAEKEVGL